MWNKGGHLVRSFYDIGDEADEGSNTGTFIDAGRRYCGIHTVSGKMRPDPHIGAIASSNIRSDRTRWSLCRTGYSLDGTSGSRFERDRLERRRLDLPRGIHRAHVLGSRLIRTRLERRRLDQPTVAPRRTCFTYQTLVGSDVESAQLPNSGWDPTNPGIP